MNDKFRRYSRNETRFDSHRVEQRVVIDLKRKCESFKYRFHDERGAVKVPEIERGITPPKGVSFRRSAKLVKAHMSAKREVPTIAPGDEAVTGIRTRSDFRELTLAGAIRHPGRSFDDWATREPPTGDRIENSARVFAVLYANGAPNISTNGFY